LTRFFFKSLLRAECTGNLGSCFEQTSSFVIIYVLMYYCICCYTDIEALKMLYVA
jgi:hypothetical protein